MNLGWCTQLIHSQTQTELSTIHCILRANLNFTIHAIVIILSVFVVVVLVVVPEH